MTKTISIAGATLELVDRGQGRPLLFLHAGEGLAPERPWLELLSRRFRVIAPWHPGYGNSPLIDGSGSVDDLAYLYLDLAAALKLDNALLVSIQVDLQDDSVVRLQEDLAERIVARAGSLLGVDEPASVQETFWGVRRVLEALARDRPLIVMLEDVHWGQPLLLDLVEHLAEWVRDAPMLLVVLTRPELRETREALTTPGRCGIITRLMPSSRASRRPTS